MKNPIIITNLSQLNNNNSNLCQLFTVQNFIRSQLNYQKCQGPYFHRGYPSIHSFSMLVNRFMIKPKFYSTFKIVKNKCLKLVKMIKSYSQYTFKSTIYNGFIYYPIEQKEMDSPVQQRCFSYDQLHTAFAQV